MEEKKIGVIRKLDTVGRIVIPKEIIKRFDLSELSELLIWVDDDRIILEKYIETYKCDFCRKKEIPQNIIDHNGVKVCKKCLQNLIDQVKRCNILLQGF